MNIDKPKILYVDDSAELLTCYKDLLSSEFDVITVDNPRGVVTLIAKEKPKAILLDIDMPLLNGFQVYQEIQDSLDPSQIPPIIFLSSHDDDDTVSSCFHIGAHDFIPKKTSLPQIAARLRARIMKKDSDNELVPLTQNTYLDIRNQTIISKDSRLQLTPYEYRLLYFTIKNNAPIFKSELIAKVWNGISVLEKTINTHLTNLRKKLKQFNLSINIQKDGIVKFEKLN